MTYSLDFRHRLMEQKKKGNLTFEETSERFGVGIATLFRWQKKIEPCKTRNKPATRVDMEKLKKDIEENPDAYLYERAEMLEVSICAVFFAIKRLGISCKKNSKSSKSRRNRADKVSGENDSI